MVPVRRMIRWAQEHDIMWAIDPKVKTPTLKEILNLPVENSSKDKEEGTKSKSKKKEADALGINKLPFLIKVDKLEE